MDTREQEIRRRRGATVTARARQTEDGMIHRLRAQAVPHAVISGMAAGGTLAGALAGTTGSPGALGLAVAGLGAAGATAWVRRRGGGLRGLAVGVAGACWCGWVTAAGMSWDALATLAVGGYTAALPWWRRHRLSDPPETAPPPAPVQDPDATSPPRLWAQHIACSGGPLPGTRLSGERRMRSGVRYALHLVPGRQTLARALAAVPELRTGLRLRPGQDLVLEPHPDADEATVQLTIVQRSPVLTQATPWPGGTYDAETGTIAIGPYVDGEGVACWRLHTPDSLWGGFIAGSIGSGKSRTMEAIALGLAEAGAAVWYADGQDGSSSPFLAERADWFTYGTGILEMLQAAQRVKRLRQVENRMRRWAGWRPDQTRPGLVIIIDECHVPMADPQCQTIAAELAREGRKVGISLIMASQVATLDAFGGGPGADALRSSVCAGNMLIMRSLTRTTRHVLPGVDVDPTTFPDCPGYGYLIDYTRQRRSAPARSYFLADDAMEAAAEAVQWSELEQAAAGAAGKVYARRREAADTEAELAELFAALAGGQAPAAIRPAPAPQEALPSVPRFPAVPVLRLVPAGRTAVDVVADLLAQGVSSTGDIRRRAGYGETAVREALATLAAQGRARRVRHGVWEPVTATRAGA